MSHTTTLKGIKIKDVRAIEQAVTELQKEGINIRLLKDATPRMYYRNQHGKCTYVLSLPDCRYDVGLDFNAKTGEYDVVLDLWAGAVASQIGAACPLDDSSRAGEHAIGRFSQRYGINAMKNEAQRSYPMASITETTDDTGNVHLVVEGV